MSNPETSPGGEATESQQGKELGYAKTALKENNWSEAISCLDMCISNFPNPDQSGLEKTKIDEIVTLFDSVKSEIPENEQKQIDKKLKKIQETKF